MPRSLTGRLVAAFGLLALALLVGVGGATFVVLRGLHAEATQAALDNLADSLLPQAREAVAAGNLRGAIGEIRTNLADRGIDVVLVTATGQARDLDGTVRAGDPIPLPTAAGLGISTTGTVELAGQRYLFAATAFRAGVPGQRGLAFITLDRSGAQALADLGRAVPLVVLVVVLVGLPLAFGLSRSIGGPLRRIAAAAAELPLGRTEPLPLDGPTEVRELSMTFNAMADELAATREREARLLADLRHDLRTPITVIGGFAQALADGTATGPDAERAARAIAEEAERLERLIDQLGLTERLRAGVDALRPEPIDVAALLATTAERFAGQAAADGVEVAASGPPAGIDGIVADRTAVDRMLANLVANALAVVPRPGGHVWISAAATELAPMTAGGRVRSAVAISVADDGPGFPPGTAERVFERFFRADPARSGGGSGLGLSIVRDLARAHGGTAVAEQLAPRGARVSVILPTALELPPASTGG